MLKLSIIIPHYNSWNLLKELLDTIPNENFIQIIVIDDNSDEYLNHVSSMKLRFPYVEFYQNNTGKKGAGAARNVGLKKAKGEWLLFADSDDLFISKNFPIIYNYFKSSSDLIYFTPTSFYKFTNKKSVRHIPYQNYIKEFLINKRLKNELRLRYKFEPPWSKLIRHQVIKDNSIKFEEIMHSNDVLFSAKVSYYSQKISASYETIYAIRQSSNSLTSQISQENFNIRYNAWINYVTFLKNKLTSKEFNLLNISVIPMFIIIKNNNLKFNNYLQVLKDARARGINIFDFRLLSPNFLIKSLKKNSRFNKNIKKTNKKIDKNFKEG